MRNIKKRPKNTSLLSVDYASKKAANVGIKFKTILLKQNRLGFNLLSLIIVLFSSFLIIAVYNFITHPNYNVSSTAQKLIGTPDVALANQHLKYDVVSAKYVLNGDIIGNKMKDNNVRVGGGTIPSYSFEAPTNINSRPITYYDDINNLSFSMKPNFSTKIGHYSKGQFVYPMSRHVQDVYTIKANGLAENIIIYKSLGDSTKLKYTLSLPSTLQAKIMSTGDIGVYSANPLLFGNVNATTASEQQELQKARNNSAKTYLEFVIAAPAVKTSYGTQAKASFSLNGNQVAINVSKLSNLSYPISIDPSVIVTSASSFPSNGNNDSNTNVGSTTLSTNYITGGNLNTWASGSTFSSTPKSGMISAISGNTVYLVGGQAGNGSSTFYNNVECLTLSGSSITTSNPTYTLTTNLANGSAVAYNGYLYVFGGQTSSSGYSSTIYRASLSSICSGSSNPFTSLGTSLPRNTAFSTAVAYNGYVYIIGGYNSGGLLTGIEYTSFNADGTLNSFPTAYIPSSPAAGTPAYYLSSGGLAGMGAFAFNNNLYILGGATSTSASIATTDYVSIGSNGTLGSTMTTTTSMNGAQSNFQAVENSGYVYVYSGDSGGITSSSLTTGTNISTYAQINANGSLGSWTSVAAPLSQYTSASDFYYNNYLYTVGGFNGSGTPQNYTGYTTITPVGDTAGFTSVTTNATSGAGSWDGGTNGLIMPGVAVYEGYIYVAGGCYSPTLKAVCSSIGSNSQTVANECVFWAPISPNGTVGTFTNDSNSFNYLYGTSSVTNPCTSTAASSYDRPTFSPAMTGYNGSLIIVDGCVQSATGQPCGSATTDTVAYVINSTTGGLTNFYHSSLNLSYGGDTNSDTVSWPPGQDGTFGSSIIVVNNWLYYFIGCHIANEATNYICGNGGNFNTARNQIFTTWFCLAGNGTGTATSGSWVDPGSCNAASGSNNGNPLGEGGISGWSSLESIPTGCGTMFNSLTSYGDYVYDVGGFYPVKSGTNGQLITSQEICGFAASTNTNAASLAQIAQTPVNLPSVMWGGGAQVYNGILYVYGGCTTAPSSGATDQSPPYYSGCGSFNNNIWEYPLNPTNGYVGSEVDASCNNNGTVSKCFKSTSYYTWGFGSGIYDGNLVIVDGCSTTASSTNYVCGPSYSNYTQVANLNAGGLGNLGTINSTTGSSGQIPFGTIGTGASLPSGRAGMASAVYNGYIYSYGGETTLSGATNCGAAGIQDLDTTTYYCNDLSIYNTNTPSTNPTTTTNSVLPAMTFASMVAYKDHLYVIGGLRNIGGTGTASSDVYYATICNGTNTTTNLTTNCTIGSTVGSLSSWTRESSLNVTGASWSGGAIAYDNSIYWFTGCYSTYSPVTSEPTYRLEYDCDNTGQQDSLSEPTPSNDGYMTVNPDGSLQSYNNVADGGTYRSQPSTGATTLEYNGYVYQIGGNSNYNCPIEYAQLNPSGTLTSSSTATSSSNHPWGAWSCDSDLPIPGWGGGSEGNGAGFGNGISNLTAGFAYNGYLYIMGGDQGPSNTPTASNPGIGSSSNFVTINENGNSCNDTITSSSTTWTTLCNFIIASPINANGSLGGFSWYGGMQYPAEGLAAVESGGNAYYFGGYNCSNMTASATSTTSTCATDTFYSTIYSAQINSIPHTSLYTYNYSFAQPQPNYYQDVSPHDIVISSSQAGNDTLSNLSGIGGMGITARYAQNPYECSNQQYTSSNTSPTQDEANDSTSIGVTETANLSVILPVTGASCGQTGSYKYWSVAASEFISLYIDDSNVFTFPDVSGASNSHTTISNATITYSRASLQGQTCAVSSCSSGTTTPVGGGRLRGGKTTGLNGNTNYLDAPP